MTTCRVCSSKNLYSKMYDHHLVSISNPPSTDDYSVLKNKVPEHFIFKGFVNICRDCGHGVMASIPDAEQISTFYKLQFWKKASLEQRPTSASAGQQSPKHLARAKRQQEFISKYVYLNSIKSCLEIGPGEAYLTLALKEQASQDCRFDLCEPSTSWDDYYKINKLNKVAEFFPFASDRKYHLIVASHWLEHIADPASTFQLLSDQLDDGGFLMIEVPNTANNYWSLPIKDAPHIHFFTLQSLIKLASAAGFNCIEGCEFGISLEDYLQGIEANYQSSGPTARGYSAAAIFQKVR